MNHHKEKVRGFTINDLEKWANDPRWTLEASEGLYQIPINLSWWQARRHGLILKKGNKHRVEIPEHQLLRKYRYYCAKSPDSHRGPFKCAIDFLVLDGTQVLAAAAGTVTEVVDQHNSWGPTSDSRNSLNLLTISHNNGEFSQYCHLAQTSAEKYGISRGTYVKTGQPIAEVGKTGWTDRDHLHFIVFRGFENDSPFKFKSLVPIFKRNWWNIL